uniref:Uncharacterized protein n=1 Tax=Lepeophtheirus salmonis TaxID=72036 RepID=A0A0K2UCB1_LEPSM
MSPGVNKHLKKKRVL